MHPHLRRRYGSAALTTNNIEFKGDDFPLNARLAGYALALLGIEKYENSKLMELVFTIITRDSALGIFEQLSSVSRNVEALGTLNEALFEANDADDIARAFYRFLAKPKMVKENRVFSDCLHALLECRVVEDRKTYGNRVKELCSKLKLGVEEVAVIELGCCYILCHEFELVMDTYNFTKKAGIFSLLTGVSPIRVRQIISTKGLLSTIELLKVDATRMTVDDEVFNYLIGNAGRVFAADAFQSAGQSEIPLEGFHLKTVQREALVRIVNAPYPSNILFYGKPGTGKTELSKALAVHTGMPAVFVSYGADGDERDRKTALIATANSVSEDTLIVVDEVDGLLNTHRLFQDSRVNKGWINHFLDNSRQRIIWIVNDISGVEESVRRRFAYSLQFKQLNWRQREVIWLSQLRKCRIKRFFQSIDVQQLAKTFPASPGLIAYAVRTVAQCLTPDMSTQGVHALIEEVLSRHLELAEGRTPRKKINNITDRYDPAALNTDSDLERIILGLDAWQASGSEFGMNLLFWGWPGTGKTEFAKYMAERLGKELLVKRMSDLQSMYVGQTEKQIAAAFHQAEEDDAILFLDEADSLFIDRQTAHRSWETSQTNEILTQMENFKGILICCTNLLEHLDEAAMRRFAFKIKFLPLTAKGKLRLYRSYFSSVKGSLPDELEARLSSIRNLCPGDIKAVWQRTQFLGGALTHAEVVVELGKEVSYKLENNKVPIGF